MNRQIFRAEARWQTLQDSFRWSIPEKMNIAELCCDSWARERPDQVAIIHVGADGSRQAWTYGQVKRASDGLAVALAAQGITRGDRVAVLLTQHPFVL
ncbi:AMP-binding protein, partial [Nioella sp.]